MSEREPKPKESGEREQPTSAPINPESKSGDSLEDSTITNDPRASQFQAEPLASLTPDAAVQERQPNTTNSDIDTVVRTDEGGH